MRQFVSLGDDGERHGRLRWQLSERPEQGGGWIVRGVVSFGSDVARGYGLQLGGMSDRHDVAERRLSAQFVHGGASQQQRHVQQHV